MRFYGFTADEIVSPNENLDPNFDPKCAWALKHIEKFPVEINSAPPEVLVRVPGIGFKSANKIVAARRFGPLRFEDLAKMRVVMKRAMHFITVGGRFYGREHPVEVRNLLTDYDGEERFTQLSMFSDPEISSAVITGEM